MAQLRAAHQENKTTFGLSESGRRCCRPPGGGRSRGPAVLNVPRFSPPDMSEGAVGDMTELGITESFQVKRQVLLSASEAAEMILRVDDVIKAAPRSGSLNMDPPSPPPLPNPQNPGPEIFNPCLTGREFPTTIPAKRRGGRSCGRGHLLFITCVTEFQQTLLCSFFLSNSLLRG